MYTAIILIPSSNAGPMQPGPHGEHAVQHYIHRALGLVARKFFEATRFDEAATTHLPHLMVELSCLATEQLRSTHPLTLEACLTCASEDGFSVDYTFYSEPDGRLLATWRSLHVFYDFDLERPMLLETLPSQGTHRVASPDAPYWLEPEYIRAIESLSQPAPVRTG
jgi:acyl-CoA thioesterase FadM